MGSGRTRRPIDLGKKSQTPPGIGEKSYKDGVLRLPEGAQTGIYFCPLDKGINEGTGHK